MSTNEEFPIATVRLSDELPVVRCLQATEAEFLYKQLFEEAEYTRYGISVKKGDAVFDVGGNIGMFALYCILSTEGDVNLFTFEPIPALARICEANIKEYAYPGVTRSKVFAVGLSQPSLLSEKQSAVFEFYPGYSLVCSSYGWTSEEKDSIAARLERLAGEQVDSKAVRKVVDESMAAIKVECPLRTLSAVLDEEKPGKISLLKVDVEKAEWDVLMGIRDEHWPMIEQVVIETHVIEDRVEKIAALLKTKGFCNIVVGEHSVLRYLGYREYGMMNERKDGGVNEIPCLGDCSRGVLCNIYATRN